MKRFWIGVGLLTVLLVISVWAIKAADNICQPISQLLEEAAEQKQRCERLKKEKQEENPKW